MQTSENKFEGKEMAQSNKEMNVHNPVHVWKTTLTSQVADFSPTKSFSEVFDLPDVGIKI